MIGNPEYVKGHEIGHGFNSNAVCEPFGRNGITTDIDKLATEKDEQKNVFTDNVCDSLQNSELSLGSNTANDSGYSSVCGSNSSSPQESPCPSETSSARIAKSQMNSEDLTEKVGAVLQKVLKDGKVSKERVTEPDGATSRNDDTQSQISKKQAKGPTSPASMVCIDMKEDYSKPDNAVPMHKCDSRPDNQDVHVEIEPGNLLNVPSKSVTFTFAEESGSEGGSFGSPSPSQSVKQLDEDQVEGQTLLPHPDEPVAKDEEGEIEQVKGEKCTVKGSIGVVLRILRVFTCLFFFICSLDLLGSAFQLLGGRAAGAAFSNSELLQNPICGLMLGVVSTAVLQSSSTSTSIVTTMVASHLLTVQVAIPIIMGANIGTSITGVIVSVTQAGDVSVFRRAFSAATVHDTFNWLTVFLLLPIEIASGMLYRLTTLVVDNSNLAAAGQSKQEFLKKLTKPITKLIVQLDKSVLNAVAKGDPSVANRTLLKDCSSKEYLPVALSLNSTDVVNATGMSTTEPVGNGGTTMAYETGSSNASAIGNMTFYSPVPTMVVQGKAKCWYIFHGAQLSDQAVGAILLVMALALLMFCLTFMVRDLKALLAGQMAKVIQKRINADFPGRARHLTGYFFILLGAVLTILVQSSSVVVSTLTPLVGVKFVTLQRVFPMMLGANLGTTSTAILAAFASTGNRVRPSLQIALCHMFFNLIGILVWYPIPQIRKVPLGVARYLGKTTATYKWFAFLYLIVAFFLIPLTVFGLSMLGWKVLAAIGIPVLVIILLVFTLNIIQHYKKELLPEKLQTWKFLPEFMRSLRPLDNFLRRICSVFPACRCCQRSGGPEYGAISRNTTMTSIGSDMSSRAVSPTASACASVNPSPYLIRKHSSKLISNTRV